MTYTTIKFESGPDLEVPNDENVVGALDSERNGRVLVMKIEGNAVEAYVALTPCCYTSKTAYREFDMGDYYDQELVCRECLDEVLDENIFDGVLYSIPTAMVPRVF